MLGGVLAAVAQVAHQQVPPTEDVERHEAVAVVIAVIGAEQAKDIIGDFAFNLSMLHDQGEIRVKGKSYNPKISSIILMAHC